MKKQYNLYWSAAGLVILILDSKTVSYGASEGINLCISTVIPSLFPFIFMSSVLVDMLRAKPIPFIRRIAYLLDISEEGIHCMLVGLLGGYPTGAACIAENYRKGELDKSQAELLLGSCNNAGPAFLFGIAGAIFNKKLALLAWIVHILSAFLTFLLLPKTNRRPLVNATHENTTPVAILLVRSVKNMGTICGWIIIFRVMIAICNKWLFWILPDGWRVAVCGILELSNGCCSLGQITSNAMRFLLFCCFLSLGGFCVAMQTQSVAAPLSLGWYMVGKGIQCLISMVLCGLLIPLLFFYEKTTALIFSLIFIPSTLIYIVTRHFPKKTVAFQPSVVYTKEKSVKR